MIIHTPRLEVSQVHEYARVPVECDSAPRNVAEDVHASRSQLEYISNRLDRMDEARDRILLQLQQFCRIRDVCPRIRQPPTFQLIRSTVPFEQNNDTPPISPGAGSSPYDFSKTIVENVKENGEKTRSPYPSCDNFVEFFLRRSCIKSCTLVVTFSLTNSPGLVFFGPQVPPGLLSI